MGGLRAALRAGNPRVGRARRGTARYAARRARGRWRWLRVAARVRADRFTGVADRLDPIHPPTARGEPEEELGIAADPRPGHRLQHVTAWPGLDEEEHRSRPGLEHDMGVLPGVEAIYRSPGLLAGRRER